LLAYLVLAPGSHARAALTEMLWPDLAGERAAAALRRALWDLRRRIAVGADDSIVLADRQAVSVNPHVRREVDVERFLAACGDAVRRTRDGSDGELEELRRALALYRGDLLEGLAVAGAPQLDEWLAGERERLRMVALQALRRLIAGLRGRGENVRALGYARRLLALDPWLEEAHRAVAELLAVTGQHGAALQQLDACRRVLAEELGVSPSQRTLELERRLRAPRHLTRHDGAPAPASSEPAFPRHNLPLAATPFVGREEELERIAQHLADPACRLLTLLGPGGIGKTRLAVHAAASAIGAAARRPALLDRVAMVASACEAGADGLVGAIAASLGLAPGSAVDVRERVVALLRERRVLLLLDAFEHRIADAGLLPELLAEAPEVRVIVTSRERLGVAGEWVMEVAGLGVPRAAPAAAASSDAVQLFLQGARRAAVGFAAGPGVLASIGRICRVVDGMPLAIELAAAWMHSLSPADLAGEIERTLDVLAGEGSPGRGLRAVFERSYARLAEGERRAVRLLSVLPGGMTRAAALAIAGVRAGTLRALADRSFVRFDPSTRRYAMHEVLRHYAGERLADHPDELADAGRRLRAHLAAMVAELESAVEDRGEREALAALDAEVDNLRAAWRAAVASSDAGFVAAVLPALAALCEAHGRFREGEALATEAIGVLTGGADRAPETLARARALIRRGGLRVHLGAFDEAGDDLQLALAALAGNAAPERARALFHLGDAALIQGRFDEAERLLAACRSLAEEAGAERVLANALARLGRAVLDRGRHGEARVLFERSLAVAHRLGDQQASTHAASQLGYVEYFDGKLDAAAARFAGAFERATEADDPAAVAAALSGLAYVAEDRGELDRAFSLYRQSLALAQDQGDRFGSGRALMLLGEVARKQGRLAEARQRYEESLAVNVAIDSRFIAGVLHGNLAFVACAEGEFDEARRHACEALREYRSSGSDTVALPALVALADAAAGEGDDDRALGLLALVLRHPGNRQDHRLECERVLAPIRGRRGAAAVAGALAATPALTLDAAVARVLGDPPAPPPRRGRQARARRELHARRRVSP
jgi:predicted ATPase/DNA-binding SARP family transcriptional activator/Tfp pilus assembly protein PilF